MLVADVPATRPRRWGFCKICKVVLNSELQAHQHVEGSKHRLNEQLVKEGRLPELQESKRAFHELDAESSLEENLPKRRRLSGQGAGFVGAGSRAHEKEGAVEQIARGPGDRAEADHFDRRREEKYGVSERDDLKSGRRSFEAKHDPTSGHASDISDDGRTKLIWLIGSNQLGAVHNNILNRQHTSFNLGLESRNIAIEWLVWKELALGDVMFQLEKKSAEGTPDCIVLHIGGTELADKKYSIKDELMNVVDAVFKRFQSTKIVWCEIIPDNLGVALARPISVNNIRRSIDDTLASYVLEIGGCYLRLDHDLKNRAMFKFLHDGNLHLSAMGIEKFETILRGGLVSLMARDMKIVPTMKQLPNRVNDFVARNLTMFRRKY
ncbi:hypothetical protein DPMN_021204 [Dreissena polymorpha]|uniref:C2H2-type domain-containing protein n=1 Tax=Dreissena polymorpha TaxID=45954 RepID=A0A9D4NKB8_DREPO|nr:hypothetical protein DPMN_021204 [Dreissena polymorpha]